MDIFFDLILTQEFFFFALIGFAAQLIDGSLGMAYGISANALLLSLGIVPAQASASIHIAEVATSGVSGITHYGFGNVDTKLAKRLIIPGVIGAAAGALVLVWLPVQIMKIAVCLYLAVMGTIILFKVFQNKQPEKSHRHRVVPLGLFGGFFDASGGGGWGTIVTSTLVAKGSVPRLAVGTVNMAEFFVALSSSFVFIASLPIINWTIALGLALGGAIAAPLSAYFAHLVPARTFMLLIGCTIILLSIYTISQIF